MTLDLAQIAGQVAAMVDVLDPEYEHQRYVELREAWERFDREITTEKLPPFQRRVALPKPNDDYIVAATDGSYIAPNRHYPARYYLMNIGRIVLRYGDDPIARLDSIPRLHYHDDDLVVPGTAKRVQINGTNVGPRRAADEICAVAELLSDEPTPAVALQDGTLTLWELAGGPDYLSNWVLPDFLKAIADLRCRRQPLAGYVSSPASTELVDRMREQSSADLPHVTDRILFSQIAVLEAGERSAVYQSAARVLDKYADVTLGGDPTLRISYFYLNVGYEIGRVEVPAWVANDAELLDVVHWVIFDQCQRGRGYPVALQEAHELAVLSVQDRRAMELFIERELARNGIVLTYTGKDGSKRGRFV